MKIYKYPHPCLEQVADKIESIDDEIKALAFNLIDTMYEAGGIGLSAPQVNKLLRLFVMDTSENKDHPLIFINPKIIKGKGKVLSNEGCLSLPGISRTVDRKKKIVVKARDINGQIFRQNASGLTGFCIQHEIDHLNGKLIL